MQETIADIPHNSSICLPQTIFSKKNILKNKNIEFLSKNLSEQNYNQPTNFSVENDSSIFQKKMKSDECVEFILNEVGV